LWIAVAAIARVRGRDGYLVQRRVDERDTRCAEIAPVIVRDARTERERVRSAVKCRINSIRARLSPVPITATR
jgi:hypothetical protein